MVLFATTPKASSAGETESGHNRYLEEYSTSCAKAMEAACSLAFGDSTIEARGRKLAGMLERLEIERRGGRNPTADVVVDWILTGDSVFFMYRHDPSLPLERFHVFSAGRAERRQSQTHSQAPQLAGD